MGKDKVPKKKILPPVAHANMTKPGQKHDSDRVPPAATFSADNEVKRSWIVQVDMTGKQFQALSVAAAKLGCPFERFARPRSGSAVQNIMDWFEDNI